MWGLTSRPPLAIMAWSCSSFSGVSEKPWPKAAVAGSMGWLRNSLRLLSSPATAPGRSVSGMVSMPMRWSQLQYNGGLRLCMASTMPTLLETCSTVARSITPLARRSWLKIGQPPIVTEPVSFTVVLGPIAFSWRARARLIGLKVEPGS